jgi:titin
MKTFSQIARDCRFHAGWLAALLLGLGGGPDTSAATFTVLNTNASGVGSLRQAVLDANANPGADTIAFAIAGAGVKTIAPTNALPQVIDPVTIDGTTQPGYSGTPLIQLSGQSAGASANGLLLLGGNCLVRGLAINRFALSGIRIESLGSNVIQRVFLGADPSGTVAVGNGSYGLAISGSPGNRIGGPTSSEANLISSNGIAGVFLTGLGATDNRIQGNFIGTDVSGRNVLGNGANGAHVVGAPGNWIGGTIAGSGNLISGNRQSGIYLSGVGATNNHILRNFIGTAVEGTNALPNAWDGITVVGSPANWIGAPGAGNLVSGNRFGGITLSGATATTTVVQGNYVGTDLTGRRSVGNTQSGITLVGVSGSVVGGSAVGEGNLVSGNGESGIRLTTNSTGNRVLGNKVGTDVAGTNAVPNTLHGISIGHSSNNVIGGTGSGAGNLVSGNRQNGIYLYGATTTSNLLLGNLVGLTAAGAARRSNGICGIMIEDAPRNRVGGSAAGAGNVVAANAQTGLLLVGVGASNNVIAGNLIGTDGTGNVALGNGADGLGISNASSNWIGGFSFSDRNLISGNALTGVWISGATASNNVLAGNFIGTDLLGRKAIPNQNPGIRLSAPRTLIGGSQSGAGNLISGNNNVAVSVRDAVSVDNVIQGNWIGLQADGVSELGNTWHGIEVLSNATRTAIGGAAPGAGNRITYTKTALYAGVRIRDGCNYNAIRGNTILVNAGLGIDLGANGVNANRVGAGPGPLANANLQQNYPVLSLATNRFRTVIQGTLNSVSNQTFALDFFANNPADASGYGEGQRWLGSAAVTTSAAGSASFSVVFTNSAAVTGHICATATDAAGNSSEFSANLALNPGVIADTDSDGMPDDYELAWGFNPANPADANLDADGDGVSNVSEHQAGTDPRNATDYLRILAGYPQGNNYWVNFPSQPGKRYSLLRSPVLPGAWQGLVTNFVGLGGPLWLVDTNRGAPPAAFYRIQCDP